MPSPYILPEAIHAVATTPPLRETRSKLNELMRERRQPTVPGQGLQRSPIDRLHQECRLHQDSTRRAGLLQGWLENARDSGLASRDALTGSDKLGKFHSGSEACNFNLVQCHD